MDTKTLELISKCHNKQVPLLVNDSTYQIIVNKVDANNIYAESAINSKLNIKEGNRVFIYVDSYGLSGYIYAYNIQTNMFHIVIDQKASKTTRRNHLRVDHVTKGIYREVRRKNGELMHYEVNVYEDQEQLKQILQFDMSKQVYVIDISGGGISIKSNKNFERNTIVKIQYEDLPEIDGKVKNVVTIKNGNEEMYRHGVQFINLTESMQEKIISKVFKIYNQKYKK